MDMQVAPKGELWWSHHQPEQPALWKSWIELGDSFFEAICAAPVPVDMRVLRVLKNSPIALDLYAWMNYRTFTLERSGKEQFVPWRGLNRQNALDIQQGWCARRHIALPAVRQAGFCAL